jgi:hypothetical protein
MNKYLLSVCLMIAGIAGLTNAQNAAVSFNGVYGAGVLSDTVEILLDAGKISGVSLSDGENIYIHPFYKYKQTAGDWNDQETVPCNWGEKCYPMAYSGGIYRFTINNFEAFFSITDGDEWKGHRPVGLGFVFYNEDQSKQIKADNGGDFWLNLKQDYKLDLWIHEQEEHHIDTVYHYYIGDAVKFKFDRSVKYDNVWYKSNDRLFSFALLQNGSVLRTFDNSTQFSAEGEYIVELPVAQTSVFTAATATERNNRTAEQSYNVSVAQPVVTLSQSADAVKEIEGENIDTVWAAIPIITANTVTVSVNVTGGGYYELSADSIVIPAGQLCGFTVLRVLDDGQAGVRSPLTISGGEVQNVDRTFTCSGTLTLEILNYPVITYTTIYDGKLIPRNTQVNITAVTDEACDWELFINGSSVRTVSNAISVGYDWNVSVDGSYTVRAEATNGQGNKTVSEITVRVVPVGEIPAPVLSFVTPLNGAAYPLGRNIRIEVNVEYADSLFFYADNMLLRAGVAAQTACDYMPLSAGNHTIEVVARNSVHKQTSIVGTVEITDTPFVVLSLVDTDADTNTGSITVNVVVRNADTLSLYLFGAGDTLCYYSGEAVDLMTYTFADLSEGVYSVKAVVHDVSGQSAVDLLTNIIVSMDLVDEPQENDIFKIYIQNGVLYIESNSQKSVRIYNAQGVLVRSFPAKQGVTAVDGLSKGMYIVNGKKVIVL